MHRPRSYRDGARAALALALAPLLLLVAAGCARQTTSPLATSARVTATEGAGTTALDAAGGNRAARSYVDLGAGRVTRIERQFRVRITPTGGVPGEWENFVQVERSEVVGTETRDGYEYARVRNLIESDPASARIQLFRAAQSGLYRREAKDENAVAQIDGTALPADAVFDRALARSAVAIDRRDAYLAAWARLRERAAAADAAVNGRAVDGELALRGAPATTTGQPGRVLPEEIRLLVYPFRPGNTWEVRAGFNTWTVEAVEVLSTSVGRFHVGRFRIDRKLDFGGTDQVITWWGAPGEVERQFHAEGDATDVAGTVFGKVETDEFVELVGYTAGVGR